MKTHLRNHLTEVHLRAIESAVADVKAGRVKPSAFNPRSPEDQLREALAWRQRTLVSWRSSKPRCRGYFMFPDVAGNLLVECAAYRRVMVRLGIKKSALSKLSS